MRSGEQISAEEKSSRLDAFQHHWKATVLRERPLILPRRRYVYPREAEEIERGALELLVQPGDPGSSGASDGPSASVGFDLRSGPNGARNFEPFLATCALGFADPIAPTGVWSCPDPAQLCAVAGGYAYLIDTRSPERFEQVAYRPVLNVLAAPSEGLLLFVGNQRIIAYNADGRAWESPRLSDEGISITSIDRTHLHGTGWVMAIDQEVAFTLDLHDGRVSPVVRTG